MRFSHTSGGCCGPDVHHGGGGHAGDCIGANAAIFSVVHGGAVEAAPYAHPDELGQRGPHRPGQGIETPAWRRFYILSIERPADIGLWRTDAVAATGRAEPEQVVSPRTDALLPTWRPAAPRSCFAAGRYPRQPEMVMPDLRGTGARSSAATVRHRTARAGRRRAERSSACAPPRSGSTAKPALMLPPPIATRSFLGGFASRPSPVSKPMSRRRRRRRPDDP